MKYSLEFSGVTILYERKVLSEKFPVIPKVQFLFGFTQSRVYVFYENKLHKEVLCDGKLFEMVRQSTNFVHSIQYILVEEEKFNVWSYLPMAINDDNSSDLSIGIELRRKLFTNVI
jgi:hypothetical protein